MARAQTPFPKRSGESLPRAADAEQSDLFGAARPSRLRAAARSTDPETSHAAAKRANRSISLKQLAVLDCFQRENRRYLAVTGQLLDGMIDEKLLQRYHAATSILSAERVDWYPQQSDSGLRTRRSELVTLKYVVDTGIKRLGDACGPSIVWQLTEAGITLDVQAFRTTLENKTARRKQHRSRKIAGEITP
jgi:hypothetical protein